MLILWDQNEKTPFRVSFLEFGTEAASPIKGWVKKDRSRARIHFLQFTLPQALRAQGLLKEAEHVESQSAETVLTPDECQLLGYLDKGKRKRKEKAGSLQWAYMAIARLGGFMDSKRTGIASWGALW